MIRNYASYTPYQVFINVGPFLQSPNQTIFRLFQIIIPLLNTGVMYIPNTVSNYYGSHKWVVTNDLLQTLYHISYVGIFLTSLNPMCDALIVLTIMPPYRKALKKLTVEKWKTSMASKSNQERSAVISIQPSKSNSSRARNGERIVIQGGI
jgi:hypothetical protein